MNNISINISANVCASVSRGVRLLYSLFGISSSIELSIKNRENAMFTLITLVNSCISSPFSAKTGKLVTKKKNPFTHGFGVKSIEKIVDLYSGNMTMYYRDDDHTFHTIITLQHYVN